jgi:transforming growth factor-beta-induced protein
MTRTFLVASLVAGLSVLGLCGKPAAAQTADKDLVETAVAAGQFKTLVKAIQAAGLTDALQGEGPLTVFAPTDEAFAKIPEAKLSALLADKKALAAVLTYHVVPGKVMARDVVKLDSAKTLQGQAVKIQAQGGKVRVNNANVVKADIACSNGVIHVIDAVLLPPETAPSGA